MSKKESNWTIFYIRLRQVGPKMLKNIPEDYQWWVEETSIAKDTFWPGTQDAFYTWWPEDERQAVIETFERWASNVKYNLHYMVDIWETSPPKISALREKIKLIEVNPNDKLIDYLLEGARMPLDTPKEEEDMDVPFLVEPEIPVEYLDFELLPKESSDIDGIISHIKGILSKGISNYKGKVIDETRLEKIKTIKPEKCYIGSDRWRGYVLFDFPSKNKVILECPVEGNATYILNGDWREMVKYSRYYIRLNFPDHYQWVIHKGNWLDRVRQCL